MSQAQSPATQRVLHMPPASAPADATGSDRGAGVMVASSKGFSDHTAGLSVAQTLAAAGVTPEKHQEVRVNDEPSLELEQHVLREGDVVTVVNRVSGGVGRPLSPAVR